jgi:ubiquinone/menaquinone biosynthesis C-methylase UbiE
MAAPQPTWMVLDVATGGGHTALAFAPHVARVVATDLAAEMLDAARCFLRTQTTEPISFALADGQDLPFASGAFDLVTCRIAPHHFPSAARFVRESARVLQSADPDRGARGGMLLVQDHLLPDDRIAGQYIDAWEQLRDPSHHRAFTVGEWTGMLLDAGLQQVRVEQVSKRHEFLPWAERQSCSPAVVDQLVERMLAAPEPVAAWMQPHAFGTAQASFVNHHILIAGEKH